MSCYKLLLIWEFRADLNTAFVFETQDNFQYKLLGIPFAVFPSVPYHERKSGIPIFTWRNSPQRSCQLSSDHAASLGVTCVRMSIPQRLLAFEDGITSINQ